MLSSAWSENPATRVDVARRVAGMGQAARAAAPLLREERARRRRHTAHEHGWSSDQVAAEVTLLRECEAALTALGE